MNKEEKEKLSSFVASLSTEQREQLKEVLERGELRD